MSLRKGTTVIAGGSGLNPTCNLLDFKWADHLLNDISWLRADTFSWQDGNFYYSVYQHLVTDVIGKSLQSETISDITIQFYLADDGHKITTNYTAVRDIYLKTGTSWYYIIDTTNHRFKLPIERSSKHLYFYVGNYTRNAIAQTAGLNAELFNGKADVNMVTHVVTEFQAPTVENNYTWYRKYNDGWIEQGQNYVALDTNGQLFTIPVTMANNRYNIQLTGVSGSNKTGTSVGVFVSCYDNRTTSTFTCYSGDDASFNTCYFNYLISGMYAQE